MGAIRSYKVTMWLEGGGEPENDPEVTKIVEADDKRQALDKARLAVRDENSDLNYRKIWAWCVETAPKKRT